MSKVFISYSHGDGGIADELTSVLSDCDIDYFRDVEQINWGNSITAKVREGLDDCQAILVVVSPASLKSHWVPYEIGRASALRKIILPFLTHPLLDVPHYFRDLSHITSIEEVREYFTTKFAQEAEDISCLTEQATASPLEISLDDMQIEYLLNISKPRNEGFIFGDIDEQTGRSAAQYQEAVELFEEYDLIRHNGNGYRFTPKAWKLADRLWALKILNALDPNNFTNQADLAEAVGLTDGQAEMDELERHVNDLEKHAWARVSHDLNSWDAEILTEGVTERKHGSIVL